VTTPSKAVRHFTGEERARLTEIRDSLMECYIERGQVIEVKYRPALACSSHFQALREPKTWADEAKRCFEAGSNTGLYQPQFQQPRPWLGKHIVLQESLDTATTGHHHTRVILIRLI
jgi:hypothetical protein